MIGLQTVLLPGGLADGSSAEQRAIVGRLEEIYQSKLDALEELKKSVLGKAFEGSL